MQYLSLWSAKQDPEKDYTNLNTRPRPVAVMNDSTSVEGSWIHVQNMTEISMKYNRIINNISMAMPHTGVVGASHNPMNNKRIHEPDDTVSHFFDIPSFLDVQSLTDTNPGPRVL